MGEGAGMMVSVAVLVALAVAIIGLIARYRLPARRRRWAWPCGRF